jgi:hypothetical protein
MEHGLPLSTGFESFHRWIATLPKRGIDPLHYDVVDFAALVKGRFAQSLMHFRKPVVSRVSPVQPERAPTFRSLTGVWIIRPLQDSSACWVLMSERYARALRTAAQMVLCFTR